MRIRTIVFAAVVFASVARFGVARADNKYIGDKQCIMCHKTQDDSVDVWTASKHSGAYEMLATEKAKKVNKDAQHDPNCFQCHVAGYGKDGGFALNLSDDKKSSLKGVTCEACHGPGQKYVAVMVKAKAKKVKIDEKEVADAGLVKTPDEKRCLDCHNKRSPFFVSFSYKEKVALIKHGTLKK